MGATLAAVLLVLLLGRFFAQAMGITGVACTAWLVNVMAPFPPVLMVWDRASS
ncbi:hypothetical protein MHTCC0001_36810 [Flavobacteriaceae bacterium MHTCC 0001]